MRGVIRSVGRMSASSCKVYDVWTAQHPRRSWTRQTAPIAWALYTGAVAIPGQFPRAEFLGRCEVEVHEFVTPVQPKRRRAGR